MGFRRQQAVPLEEFVHLTFRGASAAPGAGPRDAGANVAPRGAAPTARSPATDEGGFETQPTNADPPAAQAEAIAASEPPELLADWPSVDPELARPMGRPMERRRAASPIVPLLLGAAVSGIIGLAIISWPSPAPDLPVEAPAIALTPIPSPPVGAPPSALAPAPDQPAAAPAPLEPSAPSPPAAMALTREGIAQAQRDLGRLGFNAGKADGIIGKRTRAAVSAFQEAHGLPVDGKLTTDLAQRLASTR